MDFHRSDSMQIMGVNLEIYNFGQKSITLYYTYPTFTYGRPTISFPKAPPGIILKKEMIVMIVKKGVFPYKVAKRIVGVQEMLTNMVTRGHWGCQKLILLQFDWGNVVIS